jgi:hypothetical protein
MKQATYQTLLVTIATTLTILITACATSLYWQHEAITHHAAKFEANSWGLVSYHWNDEYAQVIDPNDSLVPPPLVLKSAK